MQNTSWFRSTIVIALNLLIGWFILWFHGIQAFFLPFSLTATGLLLMALLAMRPPYLRTRAVVLSFFISVLVPMIGLWVDKIEQSSFESFFFFGLIGIAFGWKECLLMFGLNTGLLVWYAKRE